MEMNGHIIYAVYDVAHSMQPNASSAKSTTKHMLMVLKFIHSYR